MAYERSTSHEELPVIQQFIDLVYTHSEPRDASGDETRRGEWQLLNHRYINEVHFVERIAANSTDSQDTAPTEMRRYELVAKLRSGNMEVIAHDPTSTKPFRRSMVGEKGHGHSMTTAEVVWCMDVVRDSEAAHLLVPLETPGPDGRNVSV
jgi:hypothetical protein